MLYPRQTEKGALVTNEQMVDPREHLAHKHRILFITGAFTGETESVNTLLAVDTLGHNPVKLVITSPGGDLDTTFLMYDTIKMMKSPIVTIGRYCASAAVIILAAGKKRYLFPHAKVMLHLPWTQISGDSREMEIGNKLMQGYKDNIINILQENGVKKTKREILKDIDREHWMNPQEAIDYGVADEIVTPRIMQEWLK